MHSELRELDRASCDLVAGGDSETSQVLHQYGRPEPPPKEINVGFLTTPMLVFHP